MYVNEISDYFRLITDEPDTTFLPNSAVTSILSQAHKKYLRVITDINEKPFTTTHNISAVIQQIDLTTAPNNLLGVAPFVTSGKMIRLQGVYGVVDSGGAVNTKTVSYNNKYGEAANIDEFTRVDKLLYILQNRVLMFNRQINADIQLQYTHSPNVDWTKLNSGDAEYVDEFDEFYDVIALLAYKQYAVKDVTINQPLDMLVNERLADLKAYFAQGQSLQGNQYVSRTWRRF